VPASNLASTAVSVGLEKYHRPAGMRLSSAMVKSTLDMKTESIRIFMAVLQKNTPFGLIVAPRG
jgi:hypothetical protein